VLGNLNKLSGEEITSLLPEFKVNGDTLISELEIELENQVDVSVCETLQIVSQSKAKLSELMEKLRPSAKLVI